MLTSMKFLIVAIQLITELVLFSLIDCVVCNSCFLVNKIVLKFFCDSFQRIYIDLFPIILTQINPDFKRFISFSL